jgi:hypothetical protein
MIVSSALSRACQYGLHEDTGLDVFCHVAYVLVDGQLVPDCGCPCHTATGEGRGSAQEGLDQGGAGDH